MDDYSPRLAPGRFAFVQSDVPWVDRQPRSCGGHTRRTIQPLIAPPNPTWSSGESTIRVPMLYCSMRLILCIGSLTTREATRPGLPDLLRGKILIDIPASPMSTAHKKHNS
jgi:hypothetical protein